VSAHRRVNLSGGELVTQVINAAGSLTTHTWDLEDRMTKVEVAGGAVNTMSYDGDGKRRRTEDSDGLRNVIWDQENIALETDSGNSTVAAYTHAPEGYGALISQRRSGASSFHHGVYPEQSRRDALGSTDRLTDASQNALITYLYRAFGQQTVLSGSHANRMTWGGRRGYYRQPDPANYWLRARIYRDLAGRFLSTDPLRRANPYRFPGNNPVMLSDPSGRQGCVQGYQVLWARHGAAEHAPGERRHSPPTNLFGGQRLRAAEIATSGPSLGLPVAAAGPSAAEASSLMKIACTGDEEGFSCLVKPPWGYWRRRGRYGPYVRVNSVQCDCRAVVREERNCRAYLQGRIRTPHADFPITEEKLVEGVCELPPPCVMIFMTPFPRELPPQDVSECLSRMGVTRRPYGCGPQSVPTSISSKMKEADFLGKKPLVHESAQPSLEAAGWWIKYCCRAKDYNWIDRAEGFMWRDTKTLKGCRYGHPSAHAAGYAVDIYNSGDTWRMWRRPPMCIQKVMEFFGWYHGPRIRVWEGHEFSYAFRADPDVPGSTGDQPHFQHLCYWP